MSRATSPPERQRPTIGRVLASARSIPARLRTTELNEIARDRRFRAFERHRTRTATRAGLAVIALAVGFDAIALSDLQGGSVGFAIASDAVVFALAVLGWWLLPRNLRHHPEFVALVATVGLALSTVASGVAAPGLAAETLGYLLVIPGLIALVLPWRTRTHGSWVAAYAVISTAYLTLDPSGRFTPDERGDLVIVLVVALGASMAGHVLLKRAQLRSFDQLRKIHRLRRQADADMTELERVHHALELTARVDPLTGAFNRRRLDEDLRAVRAHVSRSAMAYGLVAIDLDRFKAINDRDGHQAGDDVLRRVVEAIQATLRAEDALYRLGGEEFLVVLNVSSEDGLLAASDRLRTTVTGLAIVHPENRPHGVVSISLGATIVDGADLELSDDAWLARADQALYAAKAAGRNRVVCAPRASTAAAAGSSAA